MKSDFRHNVKVRVGVAVHGNRRQRFDELGEDKFTVSVVSVDTRCSVPDLSILLDESYKLLDFSVWEERIDESPVFQHALEIAEV